MEQCTDSKVMVVDDESGIRSLFSKLLELDMPDCTVETAENGAVAIDVFRNTHPKVILMDLSMPVMDGETSFREIMKLCDESDWEKPAVVFCTGYAPPDTLGEVLNEDTPHMLLSKPVSREVIVEAVQSRL